MELTAIDLYHLVNELKILEKTKITKIYQAETLLIQLHKAGFGKQLLEISNKAIWLTTEKTPAETIPQFCQALRKYLEGATLTEITQLKGERIVQITFHRKQETNYLIIELFSNGNILLLDGEKNIITAQELRAYRDRTLEKGKSYQLPPQRKNPLELTIDDLEIKDNISKTLAILGLGKKYSTIICENTKIDPQATKITPQEKKKIHQEYKKLLEKAQPHADEDELYIIPKGKPYETISQALQEITPKINPQQKIYEQKKKQIQKRIDTQQKTIQELEQQTKETQQKGEQIYEHYQELKTILEELKKAQKTHSLQEIQQKLKGHKTIKNVDPKTGNVEIEL